ncbi:MAG: mechanosensitive ion channel family protein [Xanthomonadales bacterium]|nr:mechanosensitive ion channel family protein [Xanthomonadales bacterium]
MPRHRLLPSSLPLRMLALLLALTSAHSALAQAPSLDKGRQQLERIGALLDTPQDDAALQDARNTVLKIQTQAEQASAERAPQLQALDARLAELGEAASGQGQEAADITRERRSLQQQRSELDAELRQAKLASVESAQLLDRIAAARQQTFHDQLFERTTPPWSLRFWRGLAENGDRDEQRVDSLWHDTLDAVAARWRSGPVRSAAYLGLALLVAVVVGWFGARKVPKLVGRHIPPGRLRRSAPAVARVLLSTLAAWWIVVLLDLALLPSSPPAAVAQLAALAGGLLVFAVFVTALGTVLLAVRSPSWRLPAISDEGARALSWLPLAAALAMVVATLPQRIGALVNVSLPLAMALTALAALVPALVVLWTLLRIHRLLRATGAAQDAAGTDTQPHFKPWINIVLGIGWTGVAVCLLGLLTGYVALAGFVAMQMLWTLVVLATLYLGMRFVDDLACAVFGAQGLAGRRIEHRFGLNPRHADRVAVVLSAVLRLVLALLGLIALAMPYGAGGEDLIARALGLARGISIGQLVLSPAGVVRAVAVFLLALGMFHLAKRWLDRRYLPTTALDPGMRASVVALFGYAGVVAAVAMALAAIGVGLERIAWIASALSVGIGFGLQAIVQNFVSGLILLAERPVKVGDWVSVGDAEGDIRRINVRATEIQTGDRTTVLVPNSELITKAVRNRTYSNAEGLVKIVLPMPLATDADLVRELLLQAFREHPGILEAPAPSVLIDGISDKGQVVFNASGFVATPRQAAGVRSALLFEILRRLRQFDIRMV